MSIWTDLGLKRTQDRVAIARAYGERLAEFDPEADPDRAAALCLAYERAHRFCDAMETGPLTRIAPRRAGRSRGFAVQDNAFRPRRSSPARAQEVGCAVSGFTDAVTAPLRRGDQRNAVVALRGLFRDPLFGNLRLRWVVERCLIEEVSALQEPPVDFCLAAIAAFRWEEDPRHLPPQARAVVARLCALAETERRVAGLRDLAKRWVLRMWFDRMALAAALLTGPYRPRFFRIAKFDPLTVRAVRRLLQDIHARHGVAAARSLDRRVIAWWDEALGIAPVQPARPERAA